MTDTVRIRVTVARASRVKKRGKSVQTKWRDRLAQSEKRLLYPEFKVTTRSSKLKCRKEIDPQYSGLIEYLEHSTIEAAGEDGRHMSPTTQKHVWREDGERTQARL